MDIYLLIVCFLPALGLGAYALLNVIANHVEKLHKSIKEYKAWKKWNSGYWLDEQPFPKG